MTPTRGSLQATVLAFDPATSCGSVVTDTGRVHDFDRAAFGAGGLRLLRPGQRVRASLDEQGRIVAVTISTFPDPLDADA